MSSTAIVAIHAFEPTSGDQAFEMAKRLVASRLLPKAVATPEAAFAIIVAGRELGMTAMQSLRGIHIIEGKTVLSSDTMLALALRDERCEYFKIVASCAEVACFETKRRGAPEPTRMSFSIDEAKVAGLLGKDNWRKYPAAMLRARCIAALARAVYPDIFMGVYEPDELQAPPVHATVAQATVVDAADVESDMTLIHDAEGLLARIGEASTLDELALVGRGIAARKGGITKPRLAGLQRAYLDRKAQLSAPPAEPVSEPVAVATDEGQAAQ